MKKPVSLILALMLLITCSGCFVPGRGWVVPGEEDHDRGGHHDGNRHDDSRSHDDRLTPIPR